MAMERRHRCSAAAVLTVAAGAAIAVLMPTVSRSFTGGMSLPAAPRTDSAVAMRVSPYYSNLDKERMARMRKETRLERRRAPPVTQTLDFDKLPPIEDIYARKFTGNAETDPVGGRKRYTMTVLFKSTGGKTQQEELKKQIYDYISFMKLKMSCKEIGAKVKKSPIDGAAQITLEYPMKEYGEVPRGLQTKKQYNKAIMVEFNFFSPVSALEYIKKKMFSDNNILRLLVLGHTRTFKHPGEDNELFL